MAFVFTEIMKKFLQSNGVSNFRINITGPKQDTQTFHIMINNFCLANKDLFLLRRGYVCVVWKFDINENPIIKDVQLKFS